MHHLLHILDDVVIVEEVLPLPQGGVGRAKKQVTLGLNGGAAGVTQP